MLEQLPQLPDLLQLLQLLQAQRPTQLAGDVLPFQQRQTYSGATQDQSRLNAIWPDGPLFGGALPVKRIITPGGLRGPMPSQAPANESLLRLLAPSLFG